jgi:hypothetical protein
VVKLSVNADAVPKKEAQPESRFGAFRSPSDSVTFSNNESESVEAARLQSPTNR